MAQIIEFTCHACKQPKWEVVNGTGICQSCRVSLANKARRVYLAGLKGLTVKERLERIEDTLYDLNINARLSGLESKLATY